MMYCYQSQPSGSVGADSGQSETQVGASAKRHRVDLCADGASTEAYLGGILERNGQAAFVSWFRKTVMTPADVRFCDKVKGARLFENVPWVMVQKVDAGGRPAGRVVEIGSNPKSGLGFLFLSQNIFPNREGGHEPIGLVLAYKSERVE